MKSSHIGKFAKHFLSLVLFSSLIIYLWDNRTDLYIALDLNLTVLLQLAGLILITWVLNSLPMLIFVNAMGGAIGFWENFAATLASTLGNYLPMRVGTLIRMQFFRKVHQIDYLTFVGISLYRAVFLAFASGVLGIVGLLGLSLQGTPITGAVFGVFSFLIIFPLIILLFPSSSPSNGPSRFSHYVSQLIVAHQVIRANPRAFSLLIIITLLQSVVLALRLSLSFAIISIEVPFWSLLILGPVATLVSYANITPGNLGLREWIIGGISSIAGLNFQAGIFAGSIDRSILLMLTFILAPPCLAYILRSTSKATTQ